jgi:endoglucanase
MPLPRVLKQVLSLPTAAYREDAVYDYLRAQCRTLPGVKLKTDRYGNLLAHYRHKPRGLRPVAFVAHMDHPGFVALEMTDRRTLRAAFRGGVREEYFPGAKVAFLREDTWIKGRVLEPTRVSQPTAPGRPPIPTEALVRVQAPVEPDAIGMWDLPAPTLKGDRVIARACDDLAGVAAMLALLQRLARRKAAAETYCLFTRAEEVGFVGASGAIRARTLPKRAAVASIETSSALVNAPIGGGPILRVGDRAVLYTRAVDTFCARVADDLAKRRKKFTYQRKLMDGGMCEAAAFGAHGYDVIGICLALGNYHNMNTERQKIDSEWVSLADWQGMVDFFEALVMDKQGLDVRTDPLRQRIDKLFSTNEKLLLT